MPKTLENVNKTECLLITSTVKSTATVRKRTFFRLLPDVPVIIDPESHQEFSIFMILVYLLVVSPGYEAMHRLRDCKFRFPVCKNLAGGN